MTEKPLPRVTPKSEPYWAALRDHRIDIPQCDDCGHWVFFPRPHCPKCLSQRLTWKTVSGDGELLTYTLAFAPTLPEFADELPQTLAVVQLDEGVHINTTLTGLAEDRIKVGMRVRPVFDDIVPGETTLLRFTAANNP
jgi:hypothetical protein